MRVKMMKPIDKSKDSEETIKSKEKELKKILEK